MSRTVAMWLLWAVVPIQALAADIGRLESQAFSPRPVAGWAVFELRGGLQGVDQSGNAMICAEIGVWKHIAIEACGSGAGFLYPGNNPTEMVHFRAEGTVPLVQRGRGELVLQPGFGFAEIEAGADEPGFLFGPARATDQREGAGPEGSLGLKARMWPHEKLFITAEVNGGAAYVPSAPTVLNASTPWVPFVTGTIGVGF